MFSNGKDYCPVHFGVLVFLVSYMTILDTTNSFEFELESKIKRRLFLYWDLYYKVTKILSVFYKFSVS